MCSEPVRTRAGRSASAVLGAALLGAAAGAFSHGGATGIVKERMDAMGELGDHAKAVGDMLKGQAPLAPAAVRDAADAFVRHGRRIPALFPDTEHSRRGAATEALPAIWDDADGFAALAERFVADSEAFGAAAAGLGDGATLADADARAVRATFFRAAKGCSGCHERYRLETD